MKELLLFRTFVLFPFIGISGPDLANVFHTSLAAVPWEHVIVDTTLAVCLLICSAGIWVYETQGLKTSVRNKQGYSPSPMPTLISQEG